MYSSGGRHKINVLFKLIKQNVNYSKSVWGAKKDAFRDYAEKKVDLVSEALKVITIDKPNDWSKVQEFVLNHQSNHSKKYNLANIDAVIMKCAINNNHHADSYFTYLQENKKPNLATTGLYLKSLYSEKTEDVPSERQDRILEVCDGICKSFPVLDSISLESIVCALSLTEKWKGTIELLKEIKLTTVPSAQAYSYVVSAAFLNNHEELAWELFIQMLQDNRNPTSILYDSYLIMVKNLKCKNKIKEALEKLFQFMKENSLFWPYNVVKELISFGNNRSSTSTVNFSGRCSCCKNNLSKFELTNEEFSDLKKVFLEKAIIGKDIFRKSDATEMEHFKEFIKGMSKFDVALDGLNIAYSSGLNKGSKVYSNQATSVIKYFVERNKSILLLGRFHMARWPRNTWNYINDNATVFLTKDISQDDPYLLYCTLNSGPDTILVSKDLMRGHKFLLKERKYKMLFERWLSQRQYQLLTVNSANKPIFRIPPQYSPVAQKSGKTWHIPYATEPTQNVNEHFQKTWICLNLD
ncbi:hypothetical protein GWI33_004872 [Rhynchophorus ferrugineus]|uniref:Mitochondrial ribonuclease P catalytic subunit n=1 Tax=Rhynchophorus ferrugineus TaxID=354439 RepID=A0A834IHQ1_RHYFE|nr:hypothetical protein GWI33_004872 [Rhynchophorus ferrugineus]